jgi:hypothetical protein
MKRVNPWNVLILVLLVLNLIDGFSTYYFVTRGLARELNPLMAYLLDKSPLAFLVFKIGITPMFFLMKNPKGKLMKTLIGILLTMYMGVCLIHLTGLVFLLQRASGF